MEIDRKNEKIDTDSENEIDTKNKIDIDSENEIKIEKIDIDSESEIDNKNEKKNDTYSENENKDFDGIEISNNKIKTIETKILKLINNSESIIIELTNFLKVFDSFSWVDTNNIIFIKIKEFYSSYDKIINKILNKNIVDLKFVIELDYIIDKIFFENKLLKKKYAIIKKNLKLIKTEVSLSNNFKKKDLEILFKEISNYNKTPLDKRMPMSEFLKKINNNVNIETASGIKLNFCKEIFSFVKKNEYKQKGFSCINLIINSDDKKNENILNIDIFKSARYIRINCINENIIFKDKDESIYFEDLLTFVKNMGDLYEISMFSLIDNFKSDYKIFYTQNIIKINISLENLFKKKYEKPFLYKYNFKGYAISEQTFEYNRYDLGVENNYFKEYENKSIFILFKKYLEDLLTILFEIIVSNDIINYIFFFYKENYNYEKKKLIYIYFFLKKFQSFNKISKIK